MSQAGIESSCLQQQEKWDTHVFTKIIVAEQEQPRLDYGNFNVLDPRTDQRLLEDLPARMPKLDILILNQQVLQGLHTAVFRRDLIGLMGDFSQIPVFVDSRQ